MDGFPRILKDSISAKGYVFMNIERAVEEAEILQINYMLANLKETTPSQSRKRQIEVNLNSSNERADSMDETEERENQPAAKRIKRGKSSAYIKREEASSMVEVKQKASSTNLKYINTVNRTSYFKCTIDGCNYKWKAILTDELCYNILETNLEHNHGPVERKDGIMVAIKDIIIERINGNEAVNPQAILQRAQTLGIRQLPTSLQVKNSVAYLKRVLIPHFNKTSFADLELLVKEILTDE
uniref:FLYWCH-type domain-containing protein n=1 Tax=Panagrolaimus sp. PS1159 TaxID=55785 RepID=A0AC35EVY8_9BILA